MILSEWQSGNTIPTHEGVYQRRNVFGIFFSKFKKGKWKICYERKEVAERETITSPFQDWDWRGIL